jgi:hypothetical protein
MASDSIAVTTERWLQAATRRSVPSFPTDAQAQNQILVLSAASFHYAEPRFESTDERF